MKPSFLKPIFFAWTRSFWLTAIGIAVLIFGAPVEVLSGIGSMVAVVTPWTAIQVADALNTIAPVILWASALQQRSGASRPYTINPKAL